MPEETAIVACQTCNMPGKVVFKDGEVFNTYFVCGHPTKIRDGKEVPKT